MIHPKEGIQSLDLALRCPDLSQLGVIPVRWEALAEVGLGDDPFFTEVMRQSSRASRTQKNVSSAEVKQWKETMKTLPPGQRETFLIRKIREELARVMGLPEGELPATDAGFFDLGVDSLMSVDLKNRLGRNLGLELSPTLIFQHPTISQLAKKLVAMSGEPALKEFLKATVSEAKEQRSEPESTSTPATETDLYAELEALEDLLE
jgi:acyl carrier protein